MTQAPERALPKHERLKQELRAACGHFGLTPDRLAGSVVLGLSAVDAECERLGLTDADRYIAAYSVIEGAVGLLPSATHRRLLVHSFNFEKVGHNLGFRQRTLCNELSLSEAQFKRVDQEAFSELARVLLTLGGSPHDRHEAPQQTVVHELRITVEGADSLRELLTAVFLDARREVRLAAAGTLLTAIDRALVGTNEPSEFADPEPPMATPSGSGSGGNAWDMGVEARLARAQWLTGVLAEIRRDGPEALTAIAYQHQQIRWPEEEADGYEPGPDEEFSRALGLEITGLQNRLSELLSSG